ncbi:prolyl oligopeptidase family serine peptidase [Gemmatimonadota bacterium]
MAPIQNNSRLRALPLFLFLASLTGLGAPPARGQARQVLTFQDLMKVRQIQSPSISADGGWLALAAVPDRGDGEVLVHSTRGDTRYAVPRGSAPVISPDGAWVAIRIEPSFEERETAERGEMPRPGLALLNTGTGQMDEWEEVQRFAFSGDGGWLARLAYVPREEEEGEETGAGEEAGGTEGSRTREDPGTTLTLRNLADGTEVEIAHIKSFSFDEEGDWMAYVVATPDGQGDGIYLRTLSSGGRVLPLEARAFSSVETVEWWSEGSRMAWVMAEEDEEGETGPGTLSFWDGSGVRVALEASELPEGWILPAANDLTWTRDGNRLFYGARPLNLEERERAEAGTSMEAGGETEEAFDPYDTEAILEGRGVDVWHTDDPLINSNQKLVWSREQARLLAGVFHLETGRAVQLGDTLVQLEGTPENPRWALASSSAPYLKEQTWTGGAEDIYLVSMDTGERTQVVEGFLGGGSAANGWIGVSGPALSQSPGGRFVVWFQDDQWHLFDGEGGTARILTGGMPVPFYDVDHDFPSPRGGHGVGGWLEGDEAVLIHDKYDLWAFPTHGGEPTNLTGGMGRDRGLILRVLRVDPDLEAYGPGDPIHLASFDEGDKGFGFFRTSFPGGGLEPLVEEDKRLRFLAKAEEADRILFSREDYDEFPDLWIGNMDFGGREKITDVNPGLIDRFAWGTSELVEWTSDDGVPLQGVVIKPGNYEPGRRYPVLTYFYRFFSQRLHEFNQPVINHRPSFPIYASDGYIVFLPDVRFEVGRPGISSMKAVVPGVKKLVDMGLADPDALGLHGHSWSGYTTSYIVTQTNIFAAAVAGAPVSNMTSAYGGIRWGTGLARQFQYETGQSRLSGSLWEAPMDYIQNSPLFFADRVETPLVIMHGDEDEAVPWYQSIEFYLALRRTGKQAVFLQYRGEPHHPRQYANKLDYSMKMKAFFDHYLKGAPAPDWWVEGVPYAGR